MKRNKIIATLFCTMSTIFSTVLMTSCVSVTEDKPVYYTFESLENDEVIITGLYPGLTEVKVINLVQIPGKIVKQIADNAFEGNKSLTKVVLPESITSIGDSAFKDCSNLEQVILPQGLKEIPHDAFKDCGNLKSINLTAGLERIGEWAFSGCSSLVNYSLNSKNINVFPKTLLSIGNSAFNSCYGLDKIAFYNPGVSELSLRAQTYIDTCAFDRCINVTDIVVGKSVKEIRSGAFDNNSSLENVWFYHTHPRAVGIDQKADSQVGVKLGEDIFPGCNAPNHKIHIMENPLTNYDEWRLHYHDYFDCLDIDQVVVPKN